MVRVRFKITVNVRFTIRVRGKNRVMVGLVLGYSTLYQYSGGVLAEIVPQCVAIWKSVKQILLAIIVLQCGMTEISQTHLLDNIKITITNHLTLCNCCLI